MNSACDKDLLSRKHRLMAAAVAGEQSPLPGQTSRSDRNGLAGLVHCFICGSGVTAGKELRLQVTYQRERFPFFPFLQNQEAAPGASEVSADGHALVCAVCHCFLTEQWNCFERSRTPVEKRMYWLKRPHQCDSRRVPQEWNISYDLERRIRIDGGAESDSSSYSDNMSEPEMDVVGKCVKAPGKRDSSRKNNVISVKNSPDSQGAIRYPGRVYGTQGSPKADKRGAKLMNNVCQTSEPLAKNQERVLQGCDDGPLADAPARDNGVMVRNRRWAEEGPVSCGSSRQAPLFHREGERHPNPALSSSASRQREAHSDEEEVNSTGVDPSSVTQQRLNSSAESCVCFICGSSLRHDGGYKVSVQKQERAQGEPFFPFLWLHSPPPGAMPISPAGTTLVCGSCHTSLLQQWQSFQLADVPVLQRLYVVPLNQSPAALRPSQEGKPPEQMQRVPVNDHEACFLCGQDCAGDVKVAYAEAGVGKSRGAMYFPFINMLPCPPQAQGLKNGRVHCCSKCHLILEEIWSAYRLCLSEDLITSISSFLIRYHAVTALEGSRQGHSQAGVSLQPGGCASVCYLCGADLSAGGECQLHVNPPGRCGEREPFFPFLTIHPPAPGAKPVDATGLVSACTLCYHDLLSQWAQHQSRGVISSAPSTAGSLSSNPQLPSSPWARQYNCEGFACFFCRQEQRRLGRLCSVTVARLPVFLYAPRSSRTLMVDDGRKLVIGSCMECKAMVQVGQNMQQDNPTRFVSSDLERKEHHKDSSQQRKAAVVEGSSPVSQEVKAAPATLQPAAEPIPSQPLTSDAEKGDHPCASKSFTLATHTHGSLSSNAFE